MPMSDPPPDPAPEPPGEPPEPPPSEPAPADDPSEDPSVLDPTWDRVHGIFHTLLEMDPPSRVEFLEQLADDDAALAREVGSLLAAHERASGFLADSPAPSFARAIAPGDKLGAYRIVEEIGRGGMGVVYRAVRDDESFTKEVAIKLIDPGMRSDEILRRFRAERQILAMLEHPHIARLIDGGTAADGSPYLVMEFVSGRPLLDFCDERQLGVDARLRLFLEVADAVQFAHQRLVVHRDLKSDNILVTAEGSPRLLDFGIAKLVGPETGAAHTVTAPMHRMLTPDYASPEQVKGEPATVASDVYSLGVILYELLSGSRPFKFATRTPEEILRVLTQEDPPLPSTVAARSPEGEAARRRADTTSRLRKKLTGDLDYVVMKALEKDPTRRYGSVEALAADVRRHLDGLPVLARGQSTMYRVSRFARRHRVAVATTALVVLSLVGGLAGMAWQAGVARRERDLARRRFDDVRGLAHAVIFDIHDAIANLPGSTKARETLVQHALVYLDRLSREAKGDLSLQRELAGAYSKIGDVQGRPMFPNLGRTSDALASYTKALDLLRDVAVAWPDSPLVVHDRFVVSQRLADLLRIMGRPTEAMRLTIDGQKAIEAAVAKWPGNAVFQGDLSVSSGRLTDMRVSAGDTLGALAENRRNVAIAERAFFANPQDAGWRRGALIAWTKKAELHAMRGQPDSALESYRRAEKLAVEAVRALPNNTDASRDLSIVYGARGLFLADQGQLDSALAVYDLGMKIAEQLAAADPANVLQQADVAAGHYEIGTMLMKGGRYEAAEPRFREAYARYARLASDDTTNAEFRTYVARSSRQAGEANLALAARAGTAAARATYRTRGMDWLNKSLGLYRTLVRGGMLDGEEAAAPQQIARLLEAALHGAPARR